MYPTPFFLPQPLSASVAGASSPLPKPIKTHLCGFRAASSFAVEQAGYGYGEWQGEEEVKGVVYMLNDEGEKEWFRECD